MSSNKYSSRFALVLHLLLRVVLHSVDLFLFGSVRHRTAAAAAADESVSVGASWFTKAATTVRSCEFFAFARKREAC